MTSFVRKSIAIAMVAATVTVGVISPAMAGNAVFTGRVLDNDGITPRSGVVVTLMGNESPDQIYQSQPTGSEGGFRIETAPAGSYALVADTPDGAFLADGALQLDEGKNRPLALTLNADATPNFQTGASSSGGSSSGLPGWAKWTIAGVIGVTAILLVADSTDDDESMASEF